MIRFDRPARRILLIKPSALGDVVHSLPVLRLIRRRFPEAHIAWLINPGFAGLIEGHPDLNEVIRFERKRFGRSLVDRQARAAFLGFSRELRDRRFDLVIDLQGLFRSGWLAWQTRAAVRVGFSNARELAAAFYTHRVRVGNPDVHAIERYLTVARAIGCDAGPIEFDFAITDADRASTAAMVAPAGESYAVMLPGTNWRTKRWPVEHFSAVSDGLRRERGLRSVVAGGAEDRPLGEAIESAVNLAGKTTLKQLVALLERAEVVIANDTGPMHIAAALGRPLVTVFGPTNPVRTGPYRRGDTIVRVKLPCSPCYSRVCSHCSCLNWLSPRMVLDRVAELQRPIR